MDRMPASTSLLYKYRVTLFTQVGTESGLLPVPVARTAIEIGPAERPDVVVDFAGRLGQEVYLMDAYTLTPLLQVPN